MEGGSADFASLHGCNILEQRRSSCRGAKICPIAQLDDGHDYMDVEGRVMQEQLPRKAQVSR